MIIEDINERADLLLMNVDLEARHLITDNLSSRERFSLKQIFGREYSKEDISFFVKFDQSGSEYEEIYAFSDSVPNLLKTLYPIRTKG